MPDPTAVAYAPSRARSTSTEGEPGHGSRQWANGSLRTVATGLVHPVGVAVGAPRPSGQVDGLDVSRHRLGS